MIGFMGCRGSQVRILSPRPNKSMTYIGSRRPHLRLFCFRDNSRDNNLSRHPQTLILKLFHCTEPSLLTSDFGTDHPLASCLELPLVFPQLSQAPSSEGDQPALVCAAGRFQYDLSEDGLGSNSLNTAAGLAFP